LGCGIVIPGNSKKQ